MDELDQKLLQILQKNARTPISEISKKLKKARTTIQSRLEKLERDGVIVGYRLQLGKEKPAYMIEATALVRMDPSQAPAIVRSLKTIPQIEKITTTSGRYDLMIVVQETNLEKMDDLLEKIGCIEGVRDSESLVHLSTKLDRSH